ncbi:bifunctional protein HldE [Trichonephila clavipes]|nr:bifunctional protein HldE [Trichonephila clavipes]
MKIHVPSFQSTRVLVVGDVMLDRYWSGDTSRISPGAPIPVVHIKTYLDEYSGGAENVALNTASPGVQVDFLSVCGNDEVGETLVATAVNYCNKVVHTQFASAVDTS